MNAKQHNGLLEHYVRTGSEDAFAALIQQHSSQVYAVCFAVLRERHAAEDAAQAAFLVLYRKARELPSEAMLPAWLFVVARSCAKGIQKSMIRRIKRERAAAEADRSALGGAAPEQLLEWWPEVHEELERLPARQRDAIVMCYLWNSPPGEAAAQLKCARKAFGMRVERGLATLRERLARRGAPINASCIVLMLQQSTSIAPSNTAELSASIAATCRDPALAAQYAPLVKNISAAAAKMSVSVGWLLGCALGTAVVLSGLLYVVKTEPAVRQEPPAPQKAGSDAPPVQTEKLYKRWSFKDGLASDLKVADGSWHWERGADGIGRMIPDEPAGERRYVVLLLPLNLPPKPFSIVISGRMRMRGLAIGDVDWADKEGFLANRDFQYQKDGLLTHRGFVYQGPASANGGKAAAAEFTPLTLKYLFIGGKRCALFRQGAAQDALYGITDYGTGDWPSASLGCVLIDYFVEEIELRELAPHEMREGLELMQKSMAEFLAKGIRPTDMPYLHFHKPPAKNKSGK